MLIHILFIYLLKLSACSCSIFRQMNSPFTIKQLINFDQLNKIVETALGIDQNNLFSSFTQPNKKQSSPSASQQQVSHIQTQQLPQQLQSESKQQQLNTILPKRPSLPLSLPLPIPIPKPQLSVSSLLTDSWLKNASFFNYEIDLTKPLPFTYFSSASVEPDLKFNVPEMIAFRGFKPETHQVVTKDCYILKLHRIVNPKLANQVNKKPILLQHGLMGTSGDWLINSVGGHIDDKDNRNLGFYLSKLGYVHSNIYYEKNFKANRDYYKHTI